MPADYRQMGLLVKIHRVCYTGCLAFPAADAKVFFQYNPAAPAADKRARRACFRAGARTLAGKAYCRLKTAGHAASGSDLNGTF